MKQILLVLLICLAYMQGAAQFVPEWQILNDTLYVEMTNPEGTAVNKITIHSNCDTTFTLPQSVVDDLNKKGVICVVKIAKTKMRTAGCIQCCFSIYFDDKYVANGNLYDCPKGYSVSILDTSDISKSKYPHLYYYAEGAFSQKQTISFPSIGTPNVIDSSLIHIKGNLSQYANRKDPNCNQLFWAFNRMVDAKTGDTILRTDSEGNFEAVSLAQLHSFEEILLIDSSEIGKYSQDDFEFSTDWYVANDEHRVYKVSWGTGLPGELNCNLFRGMITLADTVSTARLTLSPNPARETVAVGYELPAGADYRSCSIILVGTDGRVARTEPLLSASGKQSVSLGGIPHGQYSCIIRTAGGEVIGKENLIVE